MRSSLYGGALVFWEETNEPPYKLDRMLTHLRLSGNLAAVEGMIVGHLVPHVEDTDAAEGRSLVADSLAGFRWPLAWGLAAGHSRPNRTLPLGLPARLEPGEDRLLLGCEA